MAFRKPEICYEDQQLAAIYAHKAAVAYIPDVTLYYTVGQDSFPIRPISKRISASISR